MGDSSEWSGNLGEGNILELTGKIIVVTIVIILFVVVFVFALHLYAKWFWYRRRDSTTRGHFNFTAGHQETITTAALGGGLDPIILKTLPIMAFDPKFFKDGLECAVCLCDVSEGEKARLLPECNHGFHLDCIDRWFQSHSTCPLCRNPVANQKEANSGDESHLDSIVEAPVRENPSFPTNVLFWGDDSRVSSLGPCLDEENQSSGISKPSSASSSSSMGLVCNRHEGVSVIDIPRQVNGEEEQKSPTPARMRSLTRLLSGSRWVNVSSPRNVDVEQGSRSGQQS